jgi:uncharacterized protein (TIGR00645 family)
MSLLKFGESVMERGIFASRWLLAPLYVGMVIVQAFYCYKFGLDLYHIIHDTIGGHTVQTVVDQAGTVMERTVPYTPALFLLSVLELIDMIMVANLIIIVVIGGYATFVSKLDLDDHVDRPAWLDHIDPGTLKTKLAGGLVGVSGIHLLQSFVRLGEAGSHVDTYNVVLQIIIHGVFTVAVLIMAWADLVVEKKIAMGNHSEGFGSKGGDGAAPAAH